MNKINEEICEELYNFKTVYSDIFYLMKLFHFLYYQINEMEVYPNDDKYTAHSSLTVLSNIINNLLDKNYKQIIALYKEFENINEYTSHVQIAGQTMPDCKLT